MVLRTRAPAKINLTLHVVGRRGDGYHDLASLVAFAGVGDMLTLAPGAPLALTVAGPTAEAAGATPDNLVLKAARALGARVPGLKVGAFTLWKRLPVGAGVGGGSSDAASALRLLAELNDVPCSDPRVLEAAGATGADVPVCVDGHARMMRGTGDQLGPPCRLPRLYAVLANPGVHLDTRSVFAAMGLKPGFVSPLPADPEVESEHGFERVLTALGRGRNDMEEAACRLAPIVSDVLDILAAVPRCRLARMSGSGSTCFGLFGDWRDAIRAAATIRGRRPGWWVRATTLR